MSPDQAIAQMRTNAEALLRHYGMYDLVLYEEIREDRIFLSDSYKDDLGRHGYGRVYDMLQFELTPYPLKRDDLSMHSNWRGLRARVGWRSIEEPSDQWQRYPDGIYELDFDHFSVKRDLAGVLGHVFGEVTWPRLKARFTGQARVKTDPLRIASELRKKRHIV